MALPQHTQALLEVGQWRLPGEQADCEGARFHSPTPLFVRPTRLIPVEWDPDISARRSPTARLCGTCRDNLALLQQIFFAHGGDVDWPVRREFGNAIRALVERGWEEFDRARGGD